MSGNTYEAYIPVTDVSFPANGYALSVKLTDIVGTKKVHIEAYAHYA